MQSASKTKEAFFLKGETTSGANNQNSIFADRFIVNFFD